MHPDLITGIGLAICAAAILALLAQKCKQPLLLAYLAAGIVIGPNLGLGLVKDQASINAVSEIGLILLLYIIGLEMDIKKLLASGRTLLVSGVLQFILCAALGLGFFAMLGFALGAGRFDALYMAVALALSSTMIVVKLLYDKEELSTLPGRLTLGILVFQDLWAIVFLSIQPNLMNPQIGILALSLVKGAALVAFSLLFARYALPRLFASIARIPELLLVTAMAWCFLISALAGYLELSREMGALVAGISLSTFPYNVDVIAKVTNIRDFFVTLFFIGLGMQIPAPTPALLGMALAASLFLMATRLLTITPVLYAMKNGLRASLLPAINLAQMSEFSLVIASMGLALGHIDAHTMGVLTFVFTITSVLSTYGIKFNSQLQTRLSRLLRALGVKDLGHGPAEETTDGHGPRDIAFLGFFRDASAIFHELEHLPGPDGQPLARQTRVIDFSPTVYAAMAKRQVPCTYGDISCLDTLHHAGLGAEKVVVCSIVDTILRGTSNKRLLQSLKRICPGAFIIVASDTLPGALELYAHGADFVLVPRLHSAKDAAEVIAAALAGAATDIKECQQAMLACRNEVLS